jgi:GAF domain-containing protein
MAAAPHPPARQLAVVLAEFAQTMAEQPDADLLLVRLADYCTELLPVDGVGVLLRAEHGLAVVTANSEPGRIVEELEAALAEGPCSLALDTGEQVPIPDLAAETRFPRFTPRALEAGVRSVHALPMTVRGEAAGSVDIVALRPLHLSADELAAAQLLADVTMAYIANARLLSKSAALAEQLQHALDSRVVVEQAKGIIAERHGVTLADAFERIRERARQRRRKVHAVAVAILQGEVDV